MSTLAPRPVDPRCWRQWVVVALQLTRRRWPTALLLALAHLALFELARAWLAPLADLIRGLIVVWLTLLYCAVFVALAEAADRSVSFWGLLRERAMVLLHLAQIALLTTALFLAAILIAANLLTLLGDTAQSINAGGGIAATEREPGQPLRGWLFLLLLPCALGGWFVLPLLVGPGCKPRIACQLSLDGWLLNRFVWRIAAVWIAGVWLLPGPVVVVSGPLLGALFYVSYRHVYLGQIENSRPLPATSRTAAKALPFSTLRFCSFRCHAPY